MTIRSATFTPPHYIARVASPIGMLEISSDGEAITSLSIERAGTLPLEEFPENRDAVLERAVVQLDEYFAGVRHDFDLPIRPEGTEFQKAVWHELSALGWGEVSSYGSVGIATGRATAGRAVGGAVGSNPIPIIVPCHRILAGNGKITGYSGGNGIPTKAWLLDHEGIVHKTVIPGGGHSQLDFGEASLANAEATPLEAHAAVSETAVSETAVASR